jgi:Zn-dependent protease
MPHSATVHISHKGTSAREIRDIILADVVLTIAFALLLSGGLLSKTIKPTSILAVLPIAAVAVAVSFVLHELMHKFVAQHYGAWAEFRTWPIGLVITLASSMFGFLIGIPGATYIFSNSFTKKQNGIVSLAGPATNLVIFFVFLGIWVLISPASAYVQNALGIITFISLWLAFFNMLPIFPLDGSKVLAWNWPVYLATMLFIVALLALFFMGAII